MKIIYAKPLREKITEALLAARKENKEIEKIILTRSEWQKLRTEMSEFSRPSRYLVHTPSVMMFDGVVIEVEGDEF